MAQKALQIQSVKIRLVNFYPSSALSSFFMPKEYFILIIMASIMGLFQDSFLIYILKRKESDYSDFFQTQQ